MAFTVGHGKSEGARVHIDSFSEYVDDLIQHVKLLKTSHPGIPMFLIGHSMVGSLILLFSLKINYMSSFL